MKIRVPSYYTEFNCIASACEDTCCAGWDVVIDEETYECYQDMDGTFGEKLRSKMVVDEDGDNIFVLDGVRCPFLNSSNLCDIYKEKGAQYLCYTCKQYPRYEDEFGNIREMGISLSCPEAARIILGHTGPTEFVLAEDSQISHKTDDEHEDTLNYFFQCRADIIRIIEMADIPIGLTAAIVLKFVQELQDRIDFGEFEAINQVREKYSNSSYLKELVEALETQKGNDVTKYNHVHEYFKTYRDLEHINGNDSLGLNQVLKTFWKSESDMASYVEEHKAFNHYYKGEMVTFKKILVYFIYRYFMKSFYDSDMSSKIKVAVMSTIMIKELAVLRWMEKGDFTEEDLVDIGHKYSKDVEHLVENVDALERIFETEEVYTYDKIINTLVNEF